MRVTEREKEILSSLCKGYSDSEIAKELGISVYTVKTHIHNLLQRFGLRDRTQLVLFALKEKISSLE